MGNMAIELVTWGRHYLHIERVRSRVWSSGICGGQSGAGAGFFPSTSVSPANLHSTNCSTITLTYHLGLVQ
jgi:hypothetical protein